MDPDGDIEVPEDENVEPKKTRKRRFNSSKYVSRKQKESYVKCVEKKMKEKMSEEGNNFDDVFKKSLQENVPVTPKNYQPHKRKRKRSSLGLNQSRKKNDKYVNALMKDNPEKYAQVYADKSKTSEGNEAKRSRRKRKVCAEMSVWDNDKSTQVYLCCGSISKYVLREELMWSKCQPKLTLLTMMGMWMNICKNYRWRLRRQK